MARKPTQRAAAPRMSADERRWRAQSALETITRANEIQKDKRLMSDVQKLATEQVKTLSTVVKKPRGK